MAAGASPLLCYNRDPVNGAVETNHSRPNETAFMHTPLHLALSGHGPTAAAARRRKEEEERAVPAHHGASPSPRRQLASTRWSPVASSQSAATWSIPAHSSARTSKPAAAAATANAALSAQGTVMSAAPCSSWSRGSASAVGSRWHSASAAAMQAGESLRRPDATTTAQEAAFGRGPATTGKAVEEAGRFCHAQVVAVALDEGLAEG